MEAIKLPFSSKEFEETWQEWLQYRKERKLPKYVPTGLKRTFTHLKNIADNNEKTAIAIINQSMANNYQGFFSLQIINNGHTNNSSSNGTPARGTSIDRIEALKNW